MKPVTNQCYFKVKSSVVGNWIRLGNVLKQRRGSSKFMPISEQRHIYTRTHTLSLSLSYTHALTRTFTILLWLSERMKKKFNNIFRNFPYPRDFMHFLGKEIILNSTECVTNLDYRSEFLIFESILTTVKLSIVLKGSWGSSVNFLESKIKPP